MVFDNAVNCWWRRGSMEMKIEHIFLGSVRCLCVCVCKRLIEVYRNDVPLTYGSSIPRPVGLCKTRPIRTTLVVQIYWMPIKVYTESIQGACLQCETRNSLLFTEIHILSISSTKKQIEIQSGLKVNS